MDYARGFAAAGLDVVLFDYRGFGGSGGSPRQLVSASRQRRDYRAAIAAARRAARCRPGTHCAVGHFVLRRSRRSRRRRGRARRGGDGVDAGDRRCSCAGAAGPQRRPTSAAARWPAHGLRDAQRAMTRRRAASGADGRRAGLARDHRRSDGAEQDLHRGRGPELAQRSVCAHRARGGVQPADQVRRRVSTARCSFRQAPPTASSRPPAARRAAAERSRGELREYPIDHVDVYTEPAHQRLLADQLDFLGRHLSPAASRRAAKTTTDWSHR